MAVLVKEKVTEQEELVISFALSSSIFLHPTETQEHHGQFFICKSVLYVCLWEEHWNTSLDKSTCADGYRRVSHRKYFF